MKIQALLCAMLLLLATPALAGDGGDEGYKVQKVHKIHKVHKVHGKPGGDGDHGLFFVGSGGGLFGGGYLGVSLLDMTPELRAHMGAPEDAGVLVSKVAEDSPAAEAGVQVGDILTRVDGAELASSAQVRRKVSRLEEGSNAEIEVWRDGAPLSLTAEIAEREMAFGEPHRAFRFVPRDGFKYQFRNEEGETIDLDNLEGFDWTGIGDRLGTFFTSPEWEETLEKMRTSRGDTDERLETLEQRLKDLEKMLKKLDEK